MIPYDPTQTRKIPALQISYHVGFSSKRVAYTQNHKLLSYNLVNVYNTYALELGKTRFLR